MINIYVEYGDYDAALSLFEEMKSCAYIRPNYVTYSVIMKLYERTGNVGSARGLLREIINQNMQIDSFVKDSFNRLMDRAGQCQDKLQGSILGSKT